MNDRRGQMIATSIGGTTQGRGCDIAIIDDPVSPDQALSDAERKTANNWIDNTLRSRLNDPSTGQLDERLPATFDMKIISVDCAFKDTSTSDYVAIGVIGVKGRKRYILNVVNAHLDAAATEAEIRRQRGVHRPIGAVLVEDKANGPAVVQRLRMNVHGVIEINPEGGKTARMFAAAPEWQAGDWYVDRNAAWTEPFIEQITTFPNGRHDDMADMVTQAAAWLLRRDVSTVTFSIVRL